MCPLGDDLGNILGIDLFFEHTRSLDTGQPGFHLLNTLLQFWNGPVAQSRHNFIVILALSFLQVDLGLLKFFLQTTNLLNRFAFAFERQLH